jgi:ribosomal protein S18 acetylase RimI-like enzyme
MLGPDEWRVYRDVRLRSLAEPPDVFATTLAEARARSDSNWQRQVASEASRPQAALMAEIDAQQVGLAWCQIDDSNATRAHLFQMWVQPSFRRLGIARELLKSAISWATNLKAREIVVSVPCHQSAAVRLYTSAGFLPVGAPQPLGAGSQLLAQAMKLDLGAA